MERMRVFAVPAMVLLGSLLFAGCSGSAGTVSRNQPPEDSHRDEPPPESSPAGPAGEPVVHFSADQHAVNAGASAHLSWSASNVASCEASGGWMGARGIDGSETVGPLGASTTFTLTCTGPRGNAMAMLSVSVLKVMTLSWQPPSRNEDGTLLHDLAGYRIYYGTESGSYAHDVAVSGAETTREDVRLASGTYYFAMTAVDAEGNESAHSNEVVRRLD